MARPVTGSWSRRCRILLLAVSLPGAVDDHAGHADDLVVRAASRGGLDRQPEASSSESLERALVDRLLPLQRRLESLEDLALPDELSDRPAVEPPVRDHEHLLEGGVAVQEDEVAVEGKDAHGRPVVQSVVALLRLPQRALSL